MERATVYVRGAVQGVGFRWWTRAQARELGLAGHVKNLPDGRVEVVAQGDPTAVDALLRLLEESPSTRDRPGRVTGVVTHREHPRPGLEGFSAG